MRVSIAKCLDQGLGECFLLVLLGMCNRDTLWITFRGRSKSTQSKCELEEEKDGEREAI